MSNTSFYRGRRLRGSAALRDMVRETRLGAEDLIMGYFVVDSEDPNFCNPINSMPGQYQLSVANLEKRIETSVDNGLRSLLLFGIPMLKDLKGTEAYAKDGIVQRAVRMIKQRWPQLIVITDVCLCEYTSHGHCGLLAEGDRVGRVLNDPTLDLLAQIALSHAEAGADIVAPSDMMDGRVLAIRTALDAAGFTETPIMSYAVKYAGAFYGPFREAAESAPQFGDRRTYQMDPGNAREALREVKADIAEGADMLLVKPAGPYQDIIRLVSDNVDVPVGAYQVSGEYSMIKAASANGWIDEKAVVQEALLGIRRSGAKYIISYYTDEALAKGWVRG